MLNKNQQQKKTKLQILKNIATKIITFVGKFSGKNFLNKILKQKPSVMRNIVFTTQNYKKKNKLIRKIINKTFSIFLQ